MVTNWTKKVMAERPKQHDADAKLAEAIDRAREILRNPEADKELIDLSCAIFDLWLRFRSKHDKLLQEKEVSARLRSTVDKQKRAIRSIGRIVRTPNSYDLMDEGIERWLKKYKEML